MVLFNHYLMSQTGNGHSGRHTAACGSHYTRQTITTHTQSGMGIVGMYRLGVWTRWSGFRSAGTKLLASTHTEFRLLGKILTGETLISVEIIENRLDRTPKIQKQMILVKLEVSINVFLRLQCSLQAKYKGVGQRKLSLDPSYPTQSANQK